MKNTLKAIILTATLAGSIISFTGCGVQEVDPFENLSIEYSGISEYDTNAKVNTDSVPENIKEAFKYNINSGTSSLKNGDEIKVSVTYDEETLEELGLSATTTSKTFKVDGLNEYKESIKDCDYSVAENEIKEKIENLFKNEDMWAFEALHDHFDVSVYESYTEDVMACDYELTYEMTGVEAFYYLGPENNRQQNCFAPIFKLDLNLDVKKGAGAFEEATNKSYQKTLYITHTARVLADKDNKVFVIKDEDGIFPGEIYWRDTLEETEERLYTLRLMYELETEKLEYK